MIDLVKDNYISELWIVNFYNHKSLSFKSRSDMVKYLSGDISNEHGMMEYERVPKSVEHTEFYSIDYSVCDRKKEV